MAWPKTFLATFETRPRAVLSIVELGLGLEAVPHTTYLTFFELLLPRRLLSLCLICSLFGPVSFCLAFSLFPLAIGALSPSLSFFDSFRRRGRSSLSSCSFPLSLTSSPLSPASATDSLAVQCRQALRSLDLSIQSLHFEVAGRSLLLLVLPPSPQTCPGSRSCSSSSLSF